jgi:hypothetical protein
MKGAAAFSDGQTLRSAVERFNADEHERHSEDQVLSWLLGYADELILMLRRSLAR